MHKKELQSKIQLDCNKLDTYLEKALCNYDLPGLAVAVGFGSHTDSTHEHAYRQAAGFKAFASKEPLNVHHIFHMASVTKLFVGTAILQLWETGQLDLNETLVQYVPWIKMADERYKKITIRQLLSHTSGMPDCEDYHWDTPATDDEALERYAASPEVTEAHLLWGPEERRFSYSNIGYELLGLVIATISGMTFEQYIQKNIFDPLGMTESSLLTFQRDMKQIAVPHMKNSEKQIIPVKVFPYNRMHAPSSTLTSNLADMERWARAHLDAIYLLNLGEENQRLLLKPATYKAALAEQAQVPNNGEHICLSWFKRKQKDYVLYGHEGSDDGFRSSFWICPELDMYLLVVSNLSNGAVKKINKEIFELLI